MRPSLYKRQFIDPERGMGGAEIDNTSHAGDEVYCTFTLYDDLGERAEVYASCSIHDADTVARFRETVTCFQDMVNEWAYDALMRVERAIADGGEA